MPAALRRYVALLSVAACVCVAGAAASAARAPSFSWWGFLLVVGLFVAAALPWLEVRVGSDKLRMTWTEAAVAAGFVLLPVAWVQLAVAAAALLVALPDRRQPIKATFNTAMYIVGSAIAAVIVVVIAKPPIQPDVARDVVGVLVAAVVFGFWTDAATAVVVALSRRVRVSDVYRAGMGMQILSTVGNLVCGDRTRTPVPRRSRARGSAGAAGLPPAGLRWTAAGPEGAGLLGASAEDDADPGRSGRTHRAVTRHRGGGSALLGRVGRGRVLQRPASAGHRPRGGV